MGYPRATVSAVTRTDLKARTVSKPIVSLDRDSGGPGPTIERRSLAELFRLTAGKENPTRL